MFDNLFAAFRDDITENGAFSFFDHSIIYLSAQDIHPCSVHESNNR